MNARLLSLVVAVGLPACSTDRSIPLDPVSFGTGSGEELLAAEDLAYEALFADEDGPVVGKGIDELRTLKVHVDATAMAHARVQQLVRGVPVWGGEAIVHLTRDGKFSGLTDTLIDRVDVDTDPAYSAEEAIDLAVEVYSDGWETLSEDPRADLWVMRDAGADHLVWRVQLHQVNFTADDAMPVLFVDAHDGDLVSAYDNLQSAVCSGATNYYGTVALDCYESAGTYYLEDTTDLLGTYTWNNTTSGLYYVSSTSTAFPGSTEVSLNANEAHFAAQAVHSYLSTAHGRSGLDGAGGPAYITSHGFNFISSTTSYSNNYVNAFWDATNQYMTYGDGDGVNASSLTTLDIAGHEMQHGVTQYESNLTYSGEPGHLNESISDVFGAMVERSVQGESADTWLVGERAWTPGTAGDALRYMDDPRDDGYSYDYYFSGIGATDVHYGSGVPNLAFYLMSEGGTHPRGTSTNVVTAMGADDAADIWYLANTSYLTSSSSFATARTAMLSAASALFGATSAQYVTVGDAWTAVGVGVASTSCTSTSYSSSISRSRQSSYQPSSSGTAVVAGSQTLSLSGPSSADFDLYLEKKSGRSWSAVASSTGTTSTEAISYTGAAATYRARVYAYSGSGAYSLTWCK